MSARPVYSKPSFDPSRPTTARRKFTAQGRRFEKGEPFPWRKLMITPRRARQMYDAGILSHVSDQERMAPEKSEQATTDDLDNVETLRELRDIAEAEGAPKARSKEEQRNRIREHRAAAPTGTDE